jgi:hypothetical protein
MQKRPLFDPKTPSKPSISGEKPPKNASKTGRWREFGGSFQHLRTSNTVVLIDRADGNGPYVFFIYKNSIFLLINYANLVIMKAFF